MVKASSLRAGGGETKFRRGLFRERYNESSSFCNDLMKRKSFRGGGGGKLNSDKDYFRERYNELFCFSNDLMNRKKLQRFVSIILFSYLTPKMKRGGGGGVVSIIFFFVFKKTKTNKQTTRGGGRGVPGPVAPAPPPPLDPRLNIGNATDWSCGY